MNLLPQCGKCLLRKDNELKLFFKDISSLSEFILHHWIQLLAVQNVFCHVFKCFCFFISLQNRADKKRLNIIIVAEGAIDCHNKAITPDYIKDVSTVEKSRTHKLSCRSMDFYFLHGLLQSLMSDVPLLC